ncbi:MAG: hypothetical protein JNL12_13430 [Planctomycetes bacterium]|nr:hypothetical protein [Planctomycetota bacterium]
MPGCGNDLFLFPEFANERLYALFRSYDLQPVRSVLVIGDHLHARLDGMDPVRRIGWKLLSPRSNDLEDEAELDRLSDTATIFVASAPARSTHCVPHLLAAIEWLDAHTDGVDVGASALAWQRLQNAALPLPPGAAVVQGPDERGIVRFRLAAAATWTIDSRALAWHERRGPFASGNDVLATPSTPLQAPQSTAGSPTIVQLELRVEQADPLAGKLRQSTTVPGVADATRGARATFVMPSTFDAASPFTIELQLAPGDYEMRPWLHVGLPAR